MSAQPRLCQELEPFVGRKLVHAEWLHGVAVLYFADGARLELLDVLALAEDPNRCPGCRRLVGADERALRDAAGLPPRPWEIDREKRVHGPTDTFAGELPEHF